MISPNQDKVKAVNSNVLNGNYYGNEFPRLEMESKRFNIPGNIFVTQENY
jgi:hypothetical protein